MGVLAGIPAVGISVGTPAAHANPVSSSSAENVSEAAAASDEAAETGERVEIEEERTEYTTTYANPDGVTFSLSQSTVPVQWVDEWTIVE
ncbi:hypothetical protein GCM10010344_36110 [Streptomyces bluensis]|nr:hypothetical protein GCM10010344_36110 [Streptomyces bluensis]